MCLRDKEAGMIEREREDFGSYILNPQSLSFPFPSCFIFYLCKTCLLTKENNGKEINGERCPTTRQVLGFVGSLSLPTPTTHPTHEGR